MIELKDLLEENETIVTFHLCNEYWSRNTITVKGSDDISGALEMTLHRILEAGGTEDDVKRIMGAEIPTEDELKEALSNLETATELDPKFIDAHYYSAVVKKKLGLYESAIVSLNKVLDLQPESPYSKALKKLILTKYLHIEDK